MTPLTAEDVAQRVDENAARLDRALEFVKKFGTLLKETGRDGFEKRCDALVAEAMKENPSIALDVTYAIFHMKKISQVAFDPLITAVAGMMVVGAANRVKDD